MANASAIATGPRASAGFAKVATAMAREPRTIAEGTGRDSKVEGAENATSSFRQSEQKEAGRWKEKTAQKTREPIQSWSAKISANRNRRASSCELSAVRWASWRDKSIDIPPPPAVVVREHRIYKGWCSSCQTWHEAPVDLHEEVLGQGRLGVRLCSLIATLRNVMRLPIRQIRLYLETMHQVKISHGEIVEILHRVAKHTESLVQTIKAQIQNSGAVQADETGWREDGMNGSIWQVCTPTLRYYEYHHSRSGEIIKSLIGEDFKGVLGSDFYGGYNKHEGFHQRCWVHFLDDIRDLKKHHPSDEKLLDWAKAVKDLYHEAVTWAESGPDPGLSPAQQIQVRKTQQHLYEQRLLDLCRPFVGTDTPQRILCERVERFVTELFVFVAVPGVPSHNNLAERSLRPLVIARKISGGSRSPKGSQTRMTLASIFSTWVAQQLNPFQQCLLALITIFPNLPPAAA
jgi:transposase